MDTCLKCKYYVPRNQNDEGDGDGECHEDSPRIAIAQVTFQGPLILAAWPPVKANSWCGNHTTKLEIAKVMPS